MTEHDLVLVAEPSEGAFRVGMPRGWEGRTFLHRTDSNLLPVLEARSPDGGTYLFCNDPQIPVFFAPNGMIEYSPFVPADPTIRVHPYVPAEPFFLDYVQRRFGRASGLHVTGTVQSPWYAQKAHEARRESGRPWQITAVRIAFAFPHEGREVHGVVHGITADAGPVWTAEVYGVTTGGDEVDDAEALLMRVVDSLVIVPQWKERERARQAQQAALSRMRHQQTMAMIDADTQAMTMRHQQNMAAIQQSAQAHQSRMDALHAAADAQVQGWYAQQAQSDAAHSAYMDTLRGPSARAGHGDAGGADGDWAHRQRLNAIREENTVVGQDGRTYQVEAGHERYYKHRHDNTYVGTDATTERVDLRAKLGLNPDDYEEVWVKR